MHPPSNIEGIQYKSSDNITRGIAPDPSSKGILELGNKNDKYKGSNKKKTIWAEFNKVTDVKHMKFYSSILKQPDFKLFVVSNKPLKNYEEIKKAVAEINQTEELPKGEKNYTKGLPKGVSVICNQNFKAYAGPFAHRGLYLPPERKKENSGVISTQKTVRTFFSGSRYIGTRGISLLIR